MNLLEINHMQKSFGALEVLKDISLSVKEGEVVSIIKRLRQIHITALCHSFGADG